jgi:hypothetical protein
MFYLSGPEHKFWKRWRSLADQCQRRLTQQQIAFGNPGTILKDVNTWIEFVGPGGIVTKSRNASVPGELLPELNVKVSHPIQLALKRALLRDYPNLAGIFILLRVMDLLRMKGNRLVVCPEALEFWRSLNFAEQYFALLEALLFQAQSAVLGGGRTREDPESFEPITAFLGQLSDRWRNFDHYESVRHLGPQGGLPPWRLFVLQQLGFIEIRPADFSERDRTNWGGRGWLIGGAKLTTWGTAVAWTLLDFLNEREKEWEKAGSEDQPELEGEAAEAKPQAEFGMLQRIFRPYFPEWQTVYARPGVEPRLGTHVLKVELVGWYGGRGYGGVWRRLALPPDTSLDELAGVILHAFKLDDDHLYDFRYRDQRGKSRVYNHPYTDEGPFTPEISVGETDLALKGEMLFTFDYGDCWQFKVRLEQIEAEPCRLRGPKLVGSAGNAQAQYPESVG